MGENTCCSVCIERIDLLEKICVGLGGQMIVFSGEAAPAQGGNSLPSKLEEYHIFAKVCLLVAIS